MPGMSPQGPAGQPRSTATAADDTMLAVPSEPIWLNADPLRLAQVVGNLLNNASKFTENGGRISLTAAKGREEAEVRVRDNGVGIAADQLPFVFDMFMQAEASIECCSTGLGIGLALVKNLVEMHGGTRSAQCRRGPRERVRGASPLTKRS